MSQALLPIEGVSCAVRWSWATSWTSARRASSRALQAPGAAHAGVVHALRTHALRTRSPAVDDGTGCAMCMLWSAHATGEGTLRALT
jgi:hypothetical protein